MHSVFRKIVVIGIRLKPYSVTTRRATFWTNLFNKNKMPPINSSTQLKDEITKLIDNNKVMVFSKTTCPFCIKVRR